MKFGLHFHDEKSRYNGTVLVRSALMLEDKRLQIHFLTGNRVRKVEMCGENRNGK